MGKTKRIFNNMNIRINKLCLYIFLKLNLVTSLDPSGYGINQEQLAQANSGYKAAYAKAKQMREIHFANKAASGDIGPTEEIMQETYQERYTIHVEPRTQSCFFIEDLQVDYVLSLQYTVLSTKSGNQMDISFQLKDATGKMVVFQVRKKKDGVLNHTLTTAGDYEVCFINRYSLMESKKIMWELDIVGDEQDMETNNENNIQLAVNQTLEEYTEQARIIRVGIVRIRTKVSKARSQQWWLASKTPKDTERLVSIIQMIDTWSVAYSVAIVLVGLIQTRMVRSLFNVRPPTSNMKMRT